MNTIDCPDPGAFDGRARELYRQSLEQLPASTHARLRAARRDALSAPPGALRMQRWWPAGMAAALALAVVATLGLERPPQPATETRLVQAPATPVATSLASSDPELALMLESLDNNPDFYLWLAANDDALPALEY
ncbi:hypothetical protein LY625_00190 [Lysobacter sp. GX 14042]|uniref:hypothetical protein n=1 Tax=Lysobacter sp. GX 14042 TaxID=2907155 RepID=UPI001F17F507|nr:hypothetical protein [Lysobacter sp. GX 14042]MCE7031060.1 hypothetical protein [Lysobacter sp. GX 14042]